MELPSEDELAAVKKLHQAKRAEGGEAASGNVIPSWKVLGGSFPYQIGSLVFKLRAVPIRQAQRVHEALERLPEMLTLASLCGVDKQGVRLDYSRMAEILSANGVPSTPDLAATAWRIFCIEQLEDSIPDICDALYPLLDDAYGQGYAWPRPMPETPPQEPKQGEGAGLEEIKAFLEVYGAWEAGVREASDKALPSGCRWLDDAIADNLTELQIAALPVIIHDALGGYPGDVRESFTCA